jgi:hypothetical protein
MASGLDAKKERKPSEKSLSQLSWNVLRLQAMYSSQRDMSMCPGRTVTSEAHFSW